MEHGTGAADALRGMLNLGKMIRETGLLSATEPGRWMISEAAELQDFHLQMKVVGFPDSRVKRVLDQEMSRTGLTMKDRLESARTRLLTGAPYDSTNRQFEEMVERWCRMHPQDSSGDLRCTLLNLYDLDVFPREVILAMRESDLIDQD